MTIRGTLLGIGATFWIAAIGCWLRSHGSGRLSREGGLFLVLGIPFLVAGYFYTASSYPTEAPVFNPGPVVQIATPAPTPVPAAPAPPTYDEAVAASQVAAVARYPDLGKAGTRFNSRFVAAYRRLREENSDAFKDPDWPLRLAEKIARGEPKGR